MKRTFDIGVIGMAVMGENLSMNFERHGFSVAVYDIRDGVCDKFVNGRGKGGKFYAAHGLHDLVSSLSRPRKIMMMIKAGEPVDEVLENLLPLLEPGDIVIDGGNSRYTDTERRVKRSEAAGILYVGCGVSGGEEGALNGPSLMPGGSAAAWEQIKELLQSICAKTEDGEPCCDWVGDGGAGHFVKMVHNGIEYGDMQLICEVYQLMKDLLGLDNSEMHDVFEKWNTGKLESYLIKITSDILGYKSEDGESVLDSILDAAGQKGTGKWACIESLELGIPLTLIGEAVYARCLSARKDERVLASEILKYEAPKFSGNKKDFVGKLENALYGAKIVSYAQGYSLMREAAEKYGWKLNYGGIALMWRGGCIIRSVFLGKIKEAFAEDPALDNLLLSPYFARCIQSSQADWREVIAEAAKAGIPVPALSSALSYYDGYRCGRLPANLLQAQRDYFGAHTYERTDCPRGEFFHTNWTHEGGDTASSQYTV